MTQFVHQPLFEHGHDETEYRRLAAASEHVSTQEQGGRRILCVEGEALRSLAAEAFDDVSHLHRASHLAQLRKILDDPEASENDRFVALELLINANISAGRVLPSCQDTGTAIALAYKGENVFTGVDDAALLSQGIYDIYQTKNLRYSQVAPLDMYREKNTGSNLPAQIEIYAEPGDAYRFLFLAKGGGSANKTFLYQETKALLNPESLLRFLGEKIRTLGTAACPPYHLAVVVGGTSAEFTLKTVKLASARFLDDLPTSGNERGRAFRGRPRCSACATRRASAPSSAASTSRTTCASSACRGTAPRARWASASPARPIDRSWPRSRTTASSSSSSKRIRPGTCPRSPRRRRRATWWRST
jgi:fumarate hydratase class I